MTEDNLGNLDAQPAPVLELVVIMLAAIKIAIATWAAAWLWTL